MNCQINEGYIKCCLRHLQVDSRDNLCLFKQQIPLTGVDHPLIGVFIQAQEDLYASLSSKPKIEIQKLGDRSKFLKTKVVDYLKQVLQEAQRNIEQSQNEPASANDLKIKDLFDAIEYLFKLKLSQKEKALLTKIYMNTDLTLSTNDEMKRIITDIGESMKKTDKRCLQKAIKTANSVIR